jgi:hypothetical protein
LAETARHMRAGANFEESLGKEVRREGLDYSDYIRLASVVRDLAAKEGLTLERMAARLSRGQIDKIAGDEPISDG